MADGYAIEKQGSAGAGAACCEPVPTQHEHAAPALAIEMAGHYYPFDRHDRQDRFPEATALCLARALAAKERRRVSLVDLGDPRNPQVVKRFYFEHGKVVER